MRDATSDMLPFTIFTATYNRARLLTRLYESIRLLNGPVFEWVIVDDGSVDDTESVVRSFQKEAAFRINYVKKENGGKHTAINAGVAEAKGKFFVIIDSDDQIRPDALNDFDEAWHAIPDAEKANFDSICGLLVDQLGAVIGDRFPQDVFDADNIDLKYKYRVRGDKLSAVRTDVLRKYPFPENVGRFIPESYVWYQIGRDYRSRYINKVVATAEYQVGGLSDRSLELGINNPNAMTLYYAFLLELWARLPIRELVRAAVNLTRFGFHAGKIVWAGASFKALLLQILLLPLGLGLFLRDKARMGKKSS
ncbi:MAG: glycosyltransferase [Gammaproteobacteria bacterium]|nr:glycosyltransferase [Gammaproteobacteria bacterium]